jgi:hypothetical protein
MYVIKLDQGDYYQQRGGFDWGRSGIAGASVFDTEADAEKEIRRCGLKSFGATVKADG